MYKYPKALIASTIISLIFLTATAKAQGVAEKPKPKEFAVHFDDNEPYEIVLAAENYRREMMNETIVDKSWRDYYYSQAEKLYEKAFLIDPNFSYGYLSYGYTLLMSAEVIGDRPQRYKKAALLVDKLNKENPWVHLFAGQLNCLENNLAAGKKAFEKSLEKGGHSSNLYAWLGYALATLKDDEKAQRSYEEAVGIDSDVDTVQWARNQIGRVGKPWQFPPLVSPPAPRRAIKPASIKLRLMVTEFADSSKVIGDDGTKALSQLLTTALFHNRRFSMLDAVPSQHPSPEVLQNVEALISGVIVRANPAAGQFTLDLKAVNPQTHNLLFAKTLMVGYSKPGDNLDINDDEVFKIADLVEKKLASGNGEVLYVEGDRLIVNIGSENGVQSGFSAVIIGVDELPIRHPVTGQMLSKDIYLGEIVFERIAEKYSTARLITPGRISIKVGDVVKLK
ncbi:MAG: hypothetical protein HZA78_07685 [Candidatus Schekmanbacteria bacterium]|nr:hypothetical protein [Candidatus Schekmanbacteria bacterium]